MTPLSTAALELYLAVQHAELRAQAYLAAQPLDLEPAARDRGLLEDHRLDVAGDLADAMDRVHAGMGRRFMRALYPELPLDDGPELLAAVQQTARGLCPPGAEQAA